jgi:type 1 fimbria pilin
MNKKLSLLAAALLVTAASSASAASSTDLTVTGLITPSACTPSLSAGGIVDHGKISAKDLNQSSHTRLPRATLQMTVNCDAQTAYAVRGIDNRESSSPNMGSYGLGLINNIQKIGHYDLMFLNASADGSTTEPLESYDEGKTWIDSDGAMWQRRHLAGFGDKSSGVWYPKMIKDLTTDLIVETFIAPASGLDLTDEVKLDGSATLQIEYL